jgi:hypothetical protein
MSLTADSVEYHTTGSTAAGNDDTGISSTPPTATAAQMPATRPASTSKENHR